MSFCADVKSKTVVLTEKSDVELVYEIAKEFLGTPRRELAEAFASTILKTSNLGKGWEFGATDLDLAKELGQLFGVDFEIVELKSS